MKFKKTISLAFAMLVTLSAFYTVRSLPYRDVSSLEEKSKDEVRLILDTSIFGLALHVFRLIPDPVRTEAIMDGKIHAVYYRDTEVTIIAQPVYNNYGFVCWKGTDVPTDQRYSPDPLVVKMDKDRNYTAIYKEMSDDLGVGKRIFNETSGDYSDTIEIVVKDLSKPIVVRFECYVKPPDSKMVPYIYAVDQLPENMKYIEGSSNYRASYDGYQNTILWEGLPPSGATIYFDAIILSEGIFINRFHAYVTDHIVPSPSRIEDKDYVDWRMDYAVVYVDLVGDHTEQPTRYYTLSVSTYPSGAGYVDVDPDLDLYPEGTRVNLTAYPNPGHIFRYWSGDASGTNLTVTITMNSNKTIVAHFVGRPVLSLVDDDTDDTITVTSVSPIGTKWDDIEILCYNETTYSFIDMYGDIRVGDVIHVRDANLYGNVIADIIWRLTKEVLASFDFYIEYPSEHTTTTMYYTLSVSTYPSGAGYVDVDPDLYLYPEGTRVNLTAYPNPGYVFDHWSGDLTGIQDRITITMDSNKTIVAHFREISSPVVTVEITKPEQYYIYHNDKKISPTPFRTWIIGAITIEVNISGDKDQVDHVEFYVNNKPMHTDDTEPYSWYWDEFAVGKRTITVKAYNHIDECLDEDSINVTVVNLHGKSTEKTAQIYGHVYDYNKILKKRIPWAKIEVYEEGPDGWRRVDLSRTGRLLLRKGYYKLKIEPGHYMIKATARGYDYDTRLINLSEGDKEKIDFYLNETVLVKGKVKSKGILGHGIRGANITAIRDDGKVFTARSGLFGRYRIPLPPGNYTITIDATSKGYKVYEGNIKIRYKIFRDVINKNFYLEKGDISTDL